MSLRGWRRLQSVRPEAESNTSRTRAGWPPVRNGHPRLDPGAVGGVLGGVDTAVGVHAADQIAAVIRDRHVDHGVGGHDHLGHSLLQPIQSFTGMRRDEHRVGQRPPQLGQGQSVGGVNLVDHQQLRRPSWLSCSAITSLTTCRTALICASGLASEPSTTCTSRSASTHLLQGRPERLDQLGRQVPHEPDGVGQHERPAVVEFAHGALWVRAWRTARSRTSTPAPVSALSRLDLPALV